MSIRKQQVEGEILLDLFEPKGTGVGEGLYASFWRTDFVNSTPSPYFDFREPEREVRDNEAPHIHRDIVIDVNLLRPQDRNEELRMVQGNIL